MPARAPSRAASTGSASQDRNENNRFDFAIPLNDSNPAENNHIQHTDTTPSGGEASKTSPTGPPGSIINGINKPLNLAGFAKRKNKPEQKAFSAFAAKPRRSFDGAARSRSPDHAQQQAPRRPFSPFFPCPQELLPSHARAPRRSSPSTLQTSSSADELSANQAHIPTSRAPAVDSANADSSVLQPRGSFGNLHVSARPSLEKIHEMVEEEDLVGDRGAEIRVQTGAHPEVQVNLANSQDGPLLRRANKRLQRPEPEVEDEFDYHPAMKRYKPDHGTQERDVSRSMTHHHFHC